MVDSRGGLLFTQNGYDAIGPILPYLDGWNREDVSWTYDFDRRRYVRQKPNEIAAALDELRSLASAGLLVTATDYTAAGDEAAEHESIVNACSAGALPYAATSAFAACPRAPFRARSRRATYTLEAWNAPAKDGLPRRVTARLTPESRTLARVSERSRSE